MCALCGVLGGSGHWTDAAARPGVFTRNVERSQRRRERAHRVACASRVLQLLRPDAQRLAGQRPSSCRPRPARPRSSTISAISGPTAEKLLGPALRSARSRPDRPAGGAAVAEPVFTPVNLITGFLGSGKTTLSAAPARRSGAGRHRGADQRIRRGRARSSSAGAHRRHHGAAAVGLPVLHHPRRAGGGDQGPAFASASAGRCRASAGWSSRAPGLADPFPILSTVKADPVLRHHFRLGNVITTVDAVNGTGAARAPARVHQAGGRRRPAGADQDRPRRCRRPSTRSARGCAGSIPPRRCRAPPRRRSTPRLCCRTTCSRPPAAAKPRAAGSRRKWRRASDEPAHDRNRHDETIHAFAFTLRRAARLDPVRPVADHAAQPPRRKACCA